MRENDETRDTDHDVMLERGEGWAAKRLVELRMEIGVLTGRLDMVRRTVNGDDAVWIDAGAGRVDVYAILHQQLGKRLAYELAHEIEAAADQVDTPTAHDRHRHRIDSLTGELMAWRAWAARLLRYTVDDGTARERVEALAASALNDGQVFVSRAAAWRERARTAERELHRWRTQGSNPPVAWVFNDDVCHEGEEENTHSVTDRDEDPRVATARRHLSEGNGSVNLRRVIADLLAAWDEEHVRSPDFLLSVPARLLYEVLEAGRLAVASSEIGNADALVFAIEDYDRAKARGI